MDPAAAGAAHVVDDAVPTAAGDADPAADGRAPFNHRALELEEAGPDTYLSVDLWRPRGNRGVFGGQVVGQALAAAGRTVGAEYRCNSLHCYFLSAGAGSEMIAYEVRRLRQGASYCTRLVLAKQRGRVIFIATASFQRPEAAAMGHQYAMPAVPGPEALAASEERTGPRRRAPRAGPGEADEYSALPVEMRAVPTPAGHAGLPARAVWMRAKGDMGALGHAQHQCMLAYASDFALLGTAARPYRAHSPGSPYTLSMIVSLDHAIWFHAPFRADEWLLYVMESPRLAAGRGLVHGRIYARDGTLVASTAQEGVIRGSGPARPDLLFAHSLGPAPRL
ncbi:acyl-CoA thioesterase [Coemansia javaensis]|uniref:Acyl-CoA thioesterase n=1 Tax=Coemansia javaensis TaxID=2761396 RepID=A0A9W8LN10_9FUNG|nr:acyl-CoA thioesterase [Coemansia javaensis]